MTDARLRGAIAGLALAGAGVAAYLTYARYSGDRIVCVTGTGCETVARSRYAEVAGVPVSVLGIAGYTALFAAAAFPGVRAAALGAGLALGGLAFSAYLLVVQVAIIDAVCQWCLTSDAIMALIAVAAVFRLQRVAHASPGHRQPRTT